MPSSSLVSRFMIPGMLAAALSVGCAGNRKPPNTPRPLPDGAHADVALLETTDIHSTILSYDYYRQKDDPTLGYERTVTLIHRARAEFANTFLFDSGDTIQGSVLADYQARVKPVACGEELAIYRVMDAVGYDGGTIGNHEFNDGLDFLSQVTGTSMMRDSDAGHRCAGPHFPLVLANVFNANSGQPIFKPWTIVQKPIEVYTPDGSKLIVPLRIGIIGFTPPPIMQWDKQKLRGKVSASGVVEAARKYLPELEARHPDLIVALVHGGLDPSPYTSETENAAWHLAGVPGIDAMLLGHSHRQFPGPHYAGMPAVDAKRGYVRGVPTVMGGFFGKALGLVHVALDRQHGQWVVDKVHTRSEVWPICGKPDGTGHSGAGHNGTDKGDASKNDCVPADPQIAALVAPLQAAAIAYVNTPIGRSGIRLSSYFADEGNLTAIGVVNAAQADYVRRELPRLHPELSSIPVLSAASAFRTGFGGPHDYTDVAPGPLTWRNAADLYLYSNTLSALKIDGAVLKAWLEKSAERFNQIDPNKPGEQALINSHYVGYNFDQIQADGLVYVIDLARPVGQRIVKLSWQGKPVTPGQPFVIATNNYRADGGGGFPGLGDQRVVLAATDATRDIVAAWLQRHPTLRAADLLPISWHFAPLKTRGPITFTAASGKQQVARDAGLDTISQLKDSGDGTAVYTIELGESQPAQKHE